VVVRDHREWHGERGERFEHRGYNGGYNGGWNGRVVREPARYERYDRYDRRPIFVGAPVIREHYYNYYRRPQLIVENCSPIPGYFWVAGAWAWTGSEWIWQAGHYQPDPSYAPGYTESYDSGY
jgi:hypothetical protein